jgi:hypothetical protein
MPNLSIENGQSYQIPNIQELRKLFQHNSQFNNRSEPMIEKMEMKGIGTHDAKELVAKLLTDKKGTDATTQLIIFDKILVSNIMKAYLDVENLWILNCLIKPMTISEIAKNCKKPLSSTYRRISLLLRGGFLQISGYKREFGKKTISAKFEKTIQNITIHMNDTTNFIVLTIKDELEKTTRFNSG